MSRPQISVVIPTYNWSSALRLAIRSVLLQTVQDFEILVVGDGCDDDSEKTVASFNDERIRWHNLEHNYGSQWAANNYAIENARADWIAYLGHDDIWYPMHLEAILRTARSESADVVTSLLAIYGPPESGVRGIAGVFATGKYSKNDFVPPTAFAHARHLYNDKVKWQDPDLVATPMDALFMIDVASAGQKSASTWELTAFKFNAAYRRNAYKIKPVAEQERMLARIEEGGDFRQQELAEILASVVAGKFVSYAMNGEPAEPGAVFRRNRKLKGAAPRFQVEELQTVRQPVRFRLEGPQMYFEWHELENDDIHGSFRWSGPMPNATIDLPVRANADLFVRVKLLKTVVPITEIGLKIDSRDLNTHVVTSADGTTVVEAVARCSEFSTEDGLAVTLTTGATVRPCDISSNSDKRWLGAAVCWIELSPLDKPSP